MPGNAGTWPCMQNETLHGGRQTVALVDGHSVRHSIARVEHNSRGAARPVQCRHTNSLSLRVNERERQRQRRRSQSRNCRCSTMSLCATNGIVTAVGDALHRWMYRHRMYLCVSLAACKSSPQRICVDTDNQTQNILRRQCTYTSEREAHRESAAQRVTEAHHE